MDMYTHVITEVALSMSECFILQIVHSGKLSWLQHLIEIHGKAFAVCHLCNTLLISLI